MTRTDMDFQGGPPSNFFQVAAGAICDDYGAAKLAPFGGVSAIGDAFDRLAAGLRAVRPVRTRTTVEVVASFGKGNWSGVPWVTFLDSRETMTTQAGLYAALLWREDLTGVYLTVMQGVTKPLQDDRVAGRIALDREAAAVRAESGPRLTTAGFDLEDPMDLRGRGKLARDYVRGTVAHKLYRRESLPTLGSLEGDLEAALSVVERRIEAREADTSGSEAVVAIYVGQIAEVNLGRGVDRRVWGWKEPHTELRGLPTGTPVVFGVGFTGGSPRTPSDQWMAGGLRRVVLARTRGEAYEDSSPVWDDEDESTSYPFRLPLEFLGEIGETPLTGERVPPAIAAGLKRSVSGGKPIVVHADVSMLYAKGEDAPMSSAAEITLAFREAVSESGMVFGGQAQDRLQAFVAAVLTRPFVVLSGLSGSGKTQLAMRLGEWFGASASGPRLLSVAVRPDWTGPEALLGYQDALRPSDAAGRSAWFVPDTLRFLLQAASEPEMPYLLLLDEMNLAHVERYFSDFLSGMESRHPTVPNLERGPDGEWRQARVATIPVPRNVVVVGTVNVDETTYLFSPKVLDRAMTFEVRTQTLELVASAPRPEPIGSGGAHELRGLAALIADDQWHLNEPSRYQEQLAELLRRLHSRLASSGDEFGHRLFYDSLRLAAAFEATGLDDVDHVLDYILLLKILPRLHGARRRVEPVLMSLRAFAQDPEAWDSDGQPQDDGRAARLPRTAEKLDRMLTAVRVNQFVSFTE